MRRLFLAAIALTLVAGGLSVASAAPQVGLLAGVGVVDATWHVGASAGQYASSQDLSNPVQSEWDPSLQHVKNASSYGVASRLSIRAIVLQSPGQAPVALVKNDNYLAQDMLARRAGQILAAHGSKVTYDHLLMSATHDHNSPYYATPAAGVWLFQDVMDLRMFEYQARAIARAVELAESSMRPAKLGATTVEYPHFHGNIAGSEVTENGSPAGYPLWFNDQTLTLIRIDDLRGKPIASYLNYAQHGESLETTDLISADWLAPLQRYVDRATGAPVVFSQGSVGSAEGPYEHAFPVGAAPVLSDHGQPVREIWAHVDFAQAERGAHLLSEKVIEAWKQIGANKGQVKMDRNPVVKMLTHWVAGPLSHPYPSVSNCRTGPSLDGDPGVPAAGLPDCERASDAFGQTLPAAGLDAALRSTGLPIPSNYDAPSFGAVEENARLKLQAVRLGDTLLASCACEPQADLIKALETRTDKTQNNRWDGFDYASSASVAEGWPGLKVRPCFAVVGGQSCPDPRDLTGQRRTTVGKAAFAKMEAEIHNPADGWNDPANALTAGAESPDPAAIKGNFTKRELSARCGYTVTAGLGHTGDYNGYTVSYREYMARDSYRKALTSYGPHTADYMVTHLMSLAENLRCGTPIPSDATDAVALVDEQRQEAEALAIGQVASYYLDTWSSQLPDSAGPAAPVAQPKSITRFDAATFRWVGGDNFTDNPDVVVERRSSTGAWQSFATQDGEVQTMLQTPAGVIPSLIDNRTGNQKWTWIASFEAFDAGPRADVVGGQVPNGTYRFVVKGNIRSGGATKPYQLSSKPFAVSPWQGLTGSLAAKGSTASFTPRGITYPRTYRSPFPFIADDLGGVTGGKGDTNTSVICRTCSFRPWAAHGQVASVTMTVVDAGGGAHQVSAQRTGKTWVIPINPGDRVSIAPGGVRDTFGETNGKALVAR
ncbi:MAG: hypothetical protein JWN31_1431 [Frankiales bacterium]|nr:hypothetical protein [Frankiales bacterium]